MITKSWRERIQEARVRGKFTEEDYANSANWLTCAVGEQQAAMPNIVLVKRCTCRPGCTVTGNPGDEFLDRDGINFLDAVKAHDCDRAERLLGAIEDRALQLKREHGSPLRDVMAGADRDGCGSRSRVEPGEPLDTRGA